MQHPITEHRPFGVVLIALLLALNGIVAIIAALGVLGAGATIAFIIGLIFGVALLYVAYGMWTMQSWAWGTTLILEGLDALFAVITLFGAPGAIGAWISLILAAVIIFYLTRPEVHDLFHGRPAGI